MSVSDGPRIFYEIPSPDGESGVSSVCVLLGDGGSHTTFVCDRFAVAEDRKALASTLGTVAPDIVVEVMLSNKDAWNEVAPYVHAVLRAEQDIFLGDPYVSRVSDTIR